MRLPYSLLLAAATALVTLMLTPAVMALARRIGALAQPGSRRIHREPIPTLGGLAMVVAVLLVAWAARLSPGPGQLLPLRPLIGFSLALIPVLLMGLIDDTRGVPPLGKLLAQGIAALVLFQYGFNVPVLTNPFGPPIASGVMNLPLTVAWVVLVMNAVNLIDGLDGLASGVVLIASISLWWVGRTHGNFYVMFTTSILIGVT